MSNYTKIANLIKTTDLTSQELRDLNELVIQESKNLRSIKSRSIKQSLSVGMTVMVDHPSHKSSVFTIKKINRTKLVITDTNGRNMQAPISMIIPM